MGIRSFLAFELPVDIKKIIMAVSEDVKLKPLNIRRVNVDSIHITTVFMGEVQEEQMGAIQAVAKDVCRVYGPFNIAIKGIGVFGSRRNPRVLWIGLEGAIDRMARFRDDLQKGLKPFGIKEEKRSFKPHLTLGRFRKGAKTGTHLDGLLSKYHDLTSPDCIIEELVLFKSDLRPGGAVYSRLNGWPLIGKR
jgi:2'-5' RNA ligase